MKYNKRNFTNESEMIGKFYSALPAVKRWIENLSKLDADKFKVIVPGHGEASSNPLDAINFTLGYLNFLHDNLSEAVENMLPFDEAYDAMDWSKYKDMPAARANRMNAYYVYLGLEASSVGE